jgi:hypothetical protein
MGEVSLTGVLAKLNRAYKRLEELHRLIGDFRNPEDPYRLVRHEEFDGVDTSTFRYTAHIERPIPVDDWSPVIGEFLYDTRSALDHLAWQLSVAHCAPCDAPNGVRFPIFCSKRKFFEQMRSRCGRAGRWAYSSGVYQFRAMSAEAQAQILALQPYERRKNPERDPLWVLHELCNPDKHETIPVVGSSVKTKATILLSHDMKIRIPYKRSGPFHEGTEILRIVGKHTSPDAAMKVQAEFWVHEAFGKTGPAAGAFLSQQLEDIYNDIIEQVLPRFRHIL